MKHIPDQQLLDEIKSRLEERNQALAETKSMMHELEEVNEKLKNSEKLKSQFLSNIRNEINNPLSSIIALTENIFNKKYKDDNQRHEMTALIHAEACELEFQLNNIFVASELEAGKMQPDISQSFIKSMINDVIETIGCRKICQTKLIKLITEIDDDDGFKTDADKISLVLTNLISNAAKFSEHDKTIEILASIKDKFLTIKVIDQGCGIDQSQHELIFDRFTQLDTGMTKAHKGHGLGLSISKALLDLINGTIEVESKPEQGSIFTITIPEYHPENGFDEVSLTGNEEFFMREVESEGIELF